MAGARESNYRNCHHKIFNLKVLFLFILVFGGTLILYILPISHYQKYTAGEPPVTVYNGKFIPNYSILSSLSTLEPFPLPMNESFEYFRPVVDTAVLERILVQGSLSNIPKVDSVLVGALSSVKTIYKDTTCGKFPTIFDVKYSNTYWQTFDTPEWTLHAKGAYLDTRKLNSNTSSIRILAMIERTAKSINAYCQIWFADEPDPVISKMSNFVIWPPWVKYKLNEVQPYLLTCHLPKSHLTKVPLSVSVVEEKCSNSTINLEVVYDKPTTKERFAVCVKGMDFPDEDLAMRLIEWIELQLILGAGKIFLYELANSPNTSKVLQYYKNLGKVEVIPTTLPPRLPNEPDLRHAFLKKMVALKHQTEILPYNECFYRNMYKYDYIAVVDIDEIFIPRSHYDWHEMMDDLERKSIKENPLGHSSFAFHNVYFFNNINDQDYAHYQDIPKEFGMLQHVRRTRYNFTAKVDYVKCFHSTEKVLTLHNHFPRSCFASCKSYFVREEDALMHHYKPSCFAQGNCIAKFKKEYVLDNTVWKYKRELIRRVNNVLSNIV